MLTSTTWRVLRGPEILDNSISTFHVTHLVLGFVNILLHRLDNSTEEYYYSSECHCMQWQINCCSESEKVGIIP